EGADPRAARLDRGGVHAVLEGTRPLRPLESRQLRRPGRAAEPGGDPALADRSRLRRRAVRPRARRAVRAPRGPLLGLQVSRTSEWAFLHESTWSRDRALGYPGPWVVLRVLVIAGVLAAL